MLIVQDTSQCANFPGRPSTSEAEGCLAAKGRKKSKRKINNERRKERKKSAEKRREGHERRWRDC